MKTSEIQFPEVAPFYKQYVDVLGDVELKQILSNQLQNFPKFISSIPDEKFDYAYAEGKWTVGEALYHVIDTERVFQYRALRFGRGDTTALSGFDQDVFVLGSKDKQHTKESLIKEYQVVRESTILLFESFNEEMLHQKGTASNLEWSVGALGFVICGHQKHHRNVIRERYL